MGTLMLRSLTTGWLGLSLAIGAVAHAATPGEEEFEKTIRPVLVERCYKCHGPEKQSGGLRVDSRASLLEGGEAGPALTPGEPDKSPLIQAIRYAGDLQMPPKGKLDEPVVEALTAWVSGGAPWPEAPASATAAPEAWRDHWAFRPVRKPPMPAVKDAAWVATPVDGFVLAALEAKGLTPSPMADRRTLIRRATFDLTGLPPTEEECAAFEADPSPDAYDGLVERLLASPHYGERWGRHWLDVARYADSKGYVFVEDRRYPYAFTYRDYVVRAFNEDLPYDQFVREQIAADRLVTPQDTRPLAALGFLTLGRRFLNNPHDIADDRIDVVTRGMLGLTVACARCHDHKFDPIPTEDYYSLHGIFLSSEEPAEKPLLVPATPNAQYDDYHKQMTARRAVVEGSIEAKRAEFQADFRGRMGAYLSAAAELGLDPRNPRLEEVSRALGLPFPRTRGFIRQWSRVLERTKTGHDPLMAPWHALAALPADGFAPKAAELVKGWLEAPDPAHPVNPIVARALAEAPLTSMKDVAARYAAALTQVLTPPPAPSPEIAAERAPLEALLAMADGPFTVEASEIHRLVDQTERNMLQQIAMQISELDATHPGSPPRAMAIQDSANPHDSPISLRGNPGRPGKVAPRRGPLVTAGMNERKPYTVGSGRLELAQEITRPDNPLTARVMVNRIWMHHFGVGLVGTPSDFGTRSDPPSHPELLDDLASRFIEGGWSVKSIHRLIMRSNTYKQRGDDRPDCRAVDPTNKLLWKKARRRLEFEALRDSILAASGTLDATVGGRPMDLLAAPFSTRRTLYGLIDRQNLEGVYRSFDFPSPDTTSARRFSTVVPQQALFLMNSPFVADQTRHLAARAALAQASNPEDTIRRLYAAAYGRSPEPSEIAMGVRFLAAQAAAPPPGPESGWITGFGSVDEATGRVADFQPLSHWTGTTWQTGPSVPFGEGSYLNLTVNGGHPGPNAKFSAIRRWVAPRDAILSVSGTLNHPVEPGDGVRARLVSARSGVLATWQAHQQAIATTVERVEVKEGETLDFVVDCLASDNADGFQWSPALRATDGVTGRASWDAAADFLGPPPEPLKPLEAYAQALLMANEFAFVD